MNIRPMQETDLPKIFEIYAQSKLDELSYEISEFELLPLESDIHRWSKIKASDIYVFKSSDVLGFGAIFKSEIRVLFVSPLSRGQGGGKLLLEFLISQTTGTTISLWVVSSNKVAMQLYRSYGFIAVQEFLADYNEQEVLVTEMQGS